MDELYDQILGILTRIELDMTPDPENMRIFFQWGSADIFVGVFDAGGGNRYASVRSCLLSDVRLGSPTKLLDALAAINSANQKTVTSKFVVDYEVDDLDKPASIWTEFYIPANVLSADSFVEAVGDVADDADNWDDELKNLLGSGETAEDRYRDDVEV